jgi:hypothetical protein
LALTLASSQLVCLLFATQILAHTGPAEARKLKEQIKKKGGADLKGITLNLVENVWGSARPPRPNELAKVLDLKFAGKPFQEKIEDLRKELEKQKSAGLVICKCAVSSGKANANAIRSDA